MPIDAILFDLDGVITDTAEYHYQSWKQLADEEGIPFDRSINDRLRGVSRRRSLEILLDGRTLSDADSQAWMDRKNATYQASLTHITPADLLPGVAALLDELDGAGIPYGIASASRNAAEVVRRLGIADRLGVLADGDSARHPKPAPDLFRFAAARLGVAAARCLVVEDAAAGVTAALAAGMAVLALGPVERFDTPLLRHGQFARRADLQGATVADLQALGAPDERWVVIEDAFDPQKMRHMETVFTIGNGMFASRGTFEEGFPGEVATTFAHGIFDRLPVVLTGLVNLPGWLDLRLTIDGARFGLDAGQVLDYRRALDLRTGTLQRAVRWEGPNGAVLDLLWERFASYANRYVGAWRLLVTAVNRACEVVVTTGIDGLVTNEDINNKVFLRLWETVDQGERNGVVWLHSRTQHSGLELGTAAAAAVREGTAVTQEMCAGQPRMRLSQQLAAGETLRVEKRVAYAASRDAVADAADVVGRAVTAVAGHDYDRLKADHMAAWAGLWEACDVVIEGDDEAQLATRFNLFQLLIAAPQGDERASIGAKTLSGYGYFGHVFWDTEIFILPFFMATLPQLARNMLLYRYHALAGARRKAAANGFEGAQYPWESAATGDEVTPVWVPDGRNPKELVRIWTGDIEIHISADIAYAVRQYWQVTGDDGFMRDYGAEMVLDTARFWTSRAEQDVVDGERRYAFRDVIGPDEYHEHVDNNAFTNYMAAWHLRTAVAVHRWLAEQHPAKAAELDAALALTAETVAGWEEMAGRITILYDEASGLFDQFEGFFDLEPVSPDFIVAAEQSLQTIFGIEGANRRQVIKQADVIMLLCLFRDRFDAKTWRRNWDTYMPLTDHRYGSSLGPSFHAWAACEMGRPEEAYAHFMLAARADLRNPRGNAGDGIHAASAGGVWQALVFGFAGLRFTDGEITLDPKLPAGWERLAFKVRYRGKWYRVEIGQENSRFVQL